MAQIKTPVNEVITPNSRAQETVLRMVDRIPGRKEQVSGAVIRIVCPFHADRNPSMMLNIGATERFPLGFYKCLGCSAVGGWNKIAEKLGLEKISDGDLKVDRITGHDFYSVRSELLTIKKGKSGLDQMIKDLNIELTTPFPKNKVWRSIKGTTLNKVGALLGFDYRSDDQIVLLPVIVNKTVVGCIKAIWEKEEKKLSYVTSKGEGWVSKECLLGFDYAVKMAKRKGMRLVIVEGPRDCLRLLQNGIPAVALSGAQAWSKAKLSLIIDSGVRGMIICMDSDRAGIEATNSIYSMCKNRIDYRIFDMLGIALRLQKKKKLEERPKVDPGNLPLKHLKALKELCYE